LFLFFLISGCSSFQQEYTSIKSDSAKIVFWKKHNSPDLFHFKTGLELLVKHPYDSDLMEQMMNLYQKMDDKVVSNLFRSSGSESEEHIAEQMLSFRKEMLRISLNFEIVSKMGILKNAPLCQKISQDLRISDKFISIFSELNAEEFRNTHNTPEAQKYYFRELDWFRILIACDAAEPFALMSNSKDAEFVKSTGGYFRPELIKRYLKVNEIPSPRLYSYFDFLISRQKELFEIQGKDLNEIKKIASNKVAGLYAVKASSILNKDSINYKKIGKEPRHQTRMFSPDSNEIAYIYEETNNSNDDYYGEVSIFNVEENDISVLHIFDLIKYRYRELQDDLGVRRWDDLKSDYNYKLVHFNRKYIIFKNTRMEFLFLYDRDQGRLLDWIGLEHGTTRLDIIDDLVYHDFSDWNIGFNVYQFSSGKFVSIESSVRKSKGIADDDPYFKRNFKTAFGNLYLTEPRRYDSIEAPTIMINGHQYLFGSSIHSDSRNHISLDFFDVKGGKAIFSGSIGTRCGVIEVVDLKALSENRKDYLEFSMGCTSDNDVVNVDVSGKLIATLDSLIHTGLRRKIDLTNLIVFSHDSRRIFVLKSGGKIGMLEYPFEDGFYFSDKYWEYVLAEGGKIPLTKQIEIDKEAKSRFKIRENGIIEDFELGILLDSNNIKSHYGTADANSDCASRETGGLDSWRLIGEEYARSLYKNKDELEKVGLKLDYLMTNSRYKEKNQHFIVNSTEPQQWTYNKAPVLCIHP